jgi:hypothetical protein
MTAIPVAIRVSRQRWLQLTFGIVCMAMIANLQYGCSACSAKAL